VAKRSKGAPGIYELEPGLFKVVVSLGRDSTGRYRQHARTVRGTRRQGASVPSPDRGGGSCPRIAQETLRRTSRICITACRRVQQAQRLRTRASGADGRFAAYKAEVAGSRPAAPTSTDNILRGCDASGEGWADLQVRQKSVRGSNAPSVRVSGWRLQATTPAEGCPRPGPSLQRDGQFGPGCRGCDVGASRSRMDRGFNLAGGASDLRVRGPRVKKPRVGRVVQPLVLRPPPARQRSAGPVWRRSLPRRGRERRGSGAAC
jgi:hypothetical protein